MNAFGFYISILIGFLGDFMMAWILLCYMTVQAARDNKNFQIGLFERLAAAYPTGLPVNEPEG